MPYAYDISKKTLQGVVDGIVRKELTPSTLSSRQWATMPDEVKQRAFFSSKLFQAQHLSDIKKRLIQNLEGEKVKVRDTAVGRKYWEERGLLDTINPRTGRKYGDEYVLQSRSLITRDLIDLAKERRIKPTGARPEENQGRAERIDLIFRHNIEAAINTHNYNAGMDEEVLDYFCGYEFGRLVEVKEPRDWDSRWQEAGNEVDWEGASQEVMIALKTSPIWKALNRINPFSPIPPYDWNSQMGWIREVPRRECEALGLISPSERLTPTPIDLNANVFVDISNLDPITLTQVIKEMGNKILSLKGKTFWRV